MNAPNSFLLTHIVLHPSRRAGGRWRARLAWPGRTARGPAGYRCHADPYPAIIRPGAALAQLVEHRIRNKKLYNKLYNENKVLDFFSDGLYTL